MPEKTNNIEKIPNSRKRDPLPFIFWGILLLFYGLYKLYQVMKNIEKINNLQLYLIEPIIMTIFSLIVLWLGFKSKKNIT